MRRSGRLGALAALATVVVVAAAFTSAAQGVHLTNGRQAGPASGACQLGDNGKVKHVVYIQFDNVHFERDNPNVPSDLEQMPHLLNFMKSNGTFDTNDHTILISHTGGGILSSLTGTYPDRHGQGVSNSYDYFRPDGSVGFSSSFKYWTDTTDGGNPANNPPTPSADSNYNMVNNDPPSLGGTGANRNAPAPWVPYTRAGCDVGGIGLANMELENNTAIITRSTGNTTLAAASAAGDTSISVASASNLAVGQSIVLENGTVRAETATIAGIAGTTVSLSAALANAHLSGGAVTVYTADPTGDMTRVFQAGSPEWLEGRNSQIAPSGTAARAVAQTDFVGIDIHCAAGGGICNANSANARPDNLPDEAGGYAGYKALFGTKYVNPAIAHGAACVNDTSGSAIQDPFGHCGFPGFDGLIAKSALGETAQMQEAGVPITFTYINDAHDFHGVSGNDHRAYGPGEAGYVQQLKDYDSAFNTFFTRLSNDGINKDNTLFVITVEESDHFAGSTPDDPTCDGVTKPCTYQHVTEVNGDLKRLVSTYNAINGTTATTNFSVHSDLAPNVWITGNPARTSSAARGLEQAMSDMTVTNPLHGNQEKLFVAMADPVEEQILHMTSADAARTPTFTPFAAGDYFLNASSATTCTSGSPPQPDLSACVFLPNVTPPNQTFAWNHGGIQKEIRSTWIGWVGPGVAKNGQTDKVWTDHADIRPTMLSLLGLKDDYVPDGRVVTEFLKGDAVPNSLNGNTAEELGAMYKQIDASFGRFSMDTLCASTGALASNTSGDTTYTNVENALQSLGAARDALAGQIRMALWNAEFNGQKLDNKQAKGWIEQGQGYLDQARALCGQFHSHSNFRALHKVKHIVVIYEENHSFDNLFGGWEGVNGLANADAAHTTQVNQAGNAYSCLKQVDVNLASPSPLATTCIDSTTGNTGGSFVSAFTNAPFLIDTYIPPTAKTCPSPLVFGPANGILDPNGLPGGCTRDLVHRFYQEPYQLNGGNQNRYVTGSDAVGLSMGHYDTKALPIYTYLHSKGHPDYSISDDFFQGAFGGSFLNHQWLIAAASPEWNGALNDGSSNDLHSALDANGMPNNYPLYASPLGTAVKDQQITQSCNPAATRPPIQPAFVCGNYAVNTTQPWYQPFSPGTADSRRLPPLPSTDVTIGDELTAKGVDWAWYSGGWDNAAGNTTGLGWTNGSGPACSDPNTNTGALPPGPGHPTSTNTYPYCPDGLFQFHHQPFNYYANYAPGTPGRAHLQDEKNFEQLAQTSDKHDCNLKPVSFIKPIGEENEHPGYASEHTGSDHLVDLLTMIEGSGCAKDTMVIVTYDEFGGQWDHVPPPGQGNNNGPHDVWGPGTRIPAFTIAPGIKGDFTVDNAEHDTTSIIATIEHRYGLAPLGTRDAAVNDLSTVFSAKKPQGVH
jgi:phospholipase C